MLRLLLASMMTVMLVMPATAAIKWNNPTSKNAQSEEPKIKFEPGPLEKTYCSRRLAIHPKI